MDVTELLKVLMGVLLGVTAFYLSRTVRLIDKLEEKIDKHATRLTKLEARLEAGFFTPNDRR